MSYFAVDMRDLKFNLFEMLDLDPLVSSDRYKEFSVEDLEMILDEAHKFAKEVLAPSNAPGDRTGSHLVDGQVKLPESYKQPYRMFCEGGWMSLNHSQEWGGGGAPDLLRIACDDMFFGANIGICLGMLLTPGAAHLIEAFGSDQIKNLYLKKMYSGEWSGTMCLTEPQAGSDVGAATTRATADGDRYRIQGEKIFITYGDHDATSNIVHAVLARVEGAPSGTKGLSLFAVPKYWVEADGEEIGQFNNVVCTKVEEKLGIHGSPTCAMSFGTDGPCYGYLIGSENQGMRHMFQMMNEARISVGLQGVALANVAHQAALKYAAERTQGSDVTQLKDPNAPRVPIVRHPDVRQNLLRQRAYAEGLRALTLFAAYCSDCTRILPEDGDRQRYEGLLGILTPICKAYGSDMGFRVTEWALQTFGGYGYLKDFPVEQYLRDAKIASIYEGTNGIQALDLVGRKMLGRGGADAKEFASLIGALVERNKDNSGFSTEFKSLGSALSTWSEVTQALGAAAKSKNMLIPFVHASTYLNLCGDLLMAYFLLRQAVLADRKLTAMCKNAAVDDKDGLAVRAFAKSSEEARYLHTKVQTARFFCAQELPNLHAKARAIASQDASSMEVVWEAE